VNQAEEDALVAKVMSDVMPITVGEHHCIRLAIRAAVAAERERCARVCEKPDPEWEAASLFNMVIGAELRKRAAAIRRGE
jgi:hypothetical protein